MAKLLEECFGLNSNTFEQWSLEEASGCLGQELKIVLDKSCSVCSVLSFVLRDPDFISTRKASSVRLVSPRWMKFWTNWPRNLAIHWPHFELSIA